MPITPLTALAIPAAGVAAVQFAERLGENRPFASLLSNVRGDAPTENKESPAGQAVRELEDFAALVRERLAAAGIQTSIRFELTSDENGQLRVVGEHPKKRRIEQALAGDDDLARAFSQLAASQHLGQAEHRHAQFAQQYVSGDNPTVNTSPVSAPSRFSVVINGDEVTIGEASS